jgi:hypothetical protein
MFGPGYEELYREAQERYNVHFVRGRISEAAETIDKRVQIKAEDTLTGRPLRMTVDMLVLLVGMSANYDTQPFWNPTSGNYGTYDSDHIWTAGQAQATIQYFYSEDHPNPSKIVTESNNFPQYEYSSPCVKGLWTGDYFEFKVPVKKFPANKTVKLTIPAYGRGNPLYWDIDYLDGEEWKTVQKKSFTSPDGQFTKESTVMIIHGNTTAQWEGTPFTVEIPFTEAIDSGYLQIRFKVAYGEYITINSSAVGSKECKQIEGPMFDGTCLFAFINKSKLHTSIKLEW